MSNNALVFRDAKVYLAQYDISGDLNNCKITRSADILENTAFGASYHTGQPGLKKAQAHIEGYTQFGTGQTTVDGRLTQSFALSDVPLTVSPDGGDLGELAYFMKSLESTYALGGQIGELVKFQSDHMASGINEALVEGTIMEDGKTSRVTASNTVTQNIGAVASGQRLFAVLHLLAFVGTNVTFVVKSAATDFGTPTTRLTFTQNTAAGSELLAPAAGPITDAFYRVFYTGTFTSFSAVIVIGIQ